MTDNDSNLALLKSHIDSLGNHWDHDFPTDPSKYEGVEHLVVFTYCMAGDWDTFYSLLKESIKEIESICAH